EIVMACLSKDPSRRFGSMVDVLGQLKLLGGIATGTNMISAYPPQVGDPRTRSAPPHEYGPPSISQIGGAQASGPYPTGPLPPPRPTIASPDDEPIKPPPLPTQPPPAMTTMATVTPSVVKVRVNSDPDGASVRENGVEVCASTPCDVIYEGAEADKEHKLVFA